MSKYNIKINLEITFYEGKISHHNARELIRDILMESKHFKNVRLLNYQGNSLNDDNPFSDVRREILEASSTFWERLPEILPLQSDDQSSQ